MTIKVKYIFVVSVGVLLIAIQIKAHLESAPTKHLEHLFSLSSAKEQFNESGLKNFHNQLVCLSKEGTLFFEKKYGQPLDSNIYFRLLGETIQTYPHHLLSAKKTNDTLFIQLQYNLRKPITVTFVLTNKQDIYKITEIKNLCDLFTAVSTDIEKRKDIKNDD